MSVTTFEAETFTIEVETPADGILSVAHPDYPGWQATVDGESIAILRAYGGVSAVVVPEGKHTVRFTYDPASYRVGALLSLFTWGTLALLSVVLLSRRMRHASE